MKISRMGRVKKLDSVFSRYIRLKRSVQWICTCVTCGKKFPRQAIQNWHFISRKVYKYRRDPKNCYPQCSWCNIFLKGNYQVFTLIMIDMRWRDEVERMLNDKTVFKISTSEIIELIDFYEWEVKRLIENLALEIERKS